MVIEKLDVLESSLSKLLSELADIRRSQGEMEGQLHEARRESQSSSESLRDRERVIAELREENSRLNREQIEVRDRVERILSTIPEN